MRVWDKLYWTLCRAAKPAMPHMPWPRSMSRFGISKARRSGQPVWRLLGGARRRVPVYATFGFGFFDREQLAAAAKLWMRRAFGG